MADDNSIFEKSDSKCVVGVALLLSQGEYLQNKWSPDTLVDVMTMNDTLHVKLFMLCQDIDNGSSRSTAQQLQVHALNKEHLR